MRDLLRLAGDAYRSVELANNVLLLLISFRSSMLTGNPERFLPQGDPSITLIAEAMPTLFRLKEILMVGTALTATTTIEVKTGGDTLKALSSLVDAFLGGTNKAPIDIQWATQLKLSCEALRSNMISRNIIAG